MTTFGDLIEHTRHLLSGQDADQDAVSALRAGVTESDTTFTLDGLEGASAGIAEVDLELVRVKAVDDQGEAVTLWPFGRGYRSTTATEHAAGAEVRFNPPWPAGTIAREINGVLSEMYPSVYAVYEAETLTPQPGEAVELVVPDQVAGVISVWLEDETHPGHWLRVDRWDYNRDSTDTDHPLRVFEPLRQGRRLRVVYAARPKPFNLAGALSQPFRSTTGLDDRLADLVALGVARRLAPFVDVSRLPALTAAAASAGDTRPATAGASVTRTLHSLWLARLEQESAVLAKEHPIRVHRVR